jgi:hypothetical protein
MDNQTVGAVIGNNKLTYRFTDGAGKANGVF